MLFRGFNDQLSEALEKEQEVFIAYSAMVKYFSYTNTRAHQYLDHDQHMTSKRGLLDQQLLISKDHFLREAALLLAPYLSVYERELYKAQFKRMIFSSEKPETLFKDVSFPDFLNNLCCAGAENALRLCVARFPNAIKELSDKDFNYLCVVAAMALLNCCHFALLNCFVLK